MVKELSFSVMLLFLSIVPVYCTCTSGITDTLIFLMYLSMLRRILSPIAKVGKTKMLVSTS